MPTLFALVFGIGIIAVAAHLRRRGGRRAGRFKCHDCQHMRRTFDDGVMCGYGSREVFKTRAHIRLCPDWAPSERRR